MIKYYRKKLNTLIKIITITIIIMSIITIIIFDEVNKINIEKISDKYNININETVAIYELQDNIEIYMGISILFILIIGAIWCVSSYISIRREEKSINDMEININKIYKKDYNFLINLNEETSISSFQNEVYKTTIRLQEYAKEIENEKKNLASYISDISHQLRTPLLYITILTDNLLENSAQIPLDERKMICQMSIQIDNMKWLVENLLKMAQLDTNNVTLKRSPINVGKLLKDVHSNVKVLLELKNQSLEINGNDDVSFLGDYKWNIEAITNIVKNAIEYSKENDVIHIYYEMNHLYTQIIIEDTGEGISENEINHIFDRFYKGKENNDSFGIGLTLAKKIIEAHNGEIKVESKIGKGTKFIIRYMN